MSFEDQIDEKPFNEKYLRISNIGDIEKYSILRKVLRVKSYVLRFIQKCRSLRELNQEQKSQCKAESYIHMDEITKAT